MLSCGLNPQLQDIPEVRKLGKTAQEYRAEAQSLVVKLRRANRVNATLKALCKKSVVDRIEELLISPAAKQILEMELRNFKRKPKGRRWTLKDKAFSLSIFKRSRSTYSFLSSLLTMPQDSCLRLAQKEIVVEPGFNVSLLRRLEKTCCYLVSPKESMLSYV